MNVKGRNFGLDLARAVAILAVALIHASAFFLTSYGRETVEFSVGNLFDSAARIGVPLFLMISGALMLDETRPITVKKILGKYVKNILLLLYFWSLLYAVVTQILLPIYTDTPVSIRGFLAALLYGHYHMWYLFMVVGLYLVTPFLRAFVKRENRQLVQLFLVLAVLMQFVPTVCTALSKCSNLWASIDVLPYFTRWLSQFKLSFFSQYTAYYVLGWYITHMGVSTPWKRYVWYGASAVSLLTTIWFVQMSGDYANGYSELNLLILVYSSGVFLLLNQIGQPLGKATRIGVLALSKSSFGIYIIHPIVLELLRMAVPYHRIPALYIVVSYVVVLAISWVVTVLISKLPVLKHTVRM